MGPGQRDHVRWLHGEMGMQAQVSQTCRWGSSWARQPPGQPVLLLACGWARRVQVPPDAADAPGGGVCCCSGPLTPSVTDHLQIPEAPRPHFCRQEVQVTISVMFPGSSHRTVSAHQSAGPSLAQK